MMPRLVIRNEDDLNAALDRAISLAGHKESGEVERELAEINAAVKVYEESLAVITASGRGPGSSDDVPRGDGSE
ncbi:hypothetical protein BOSEA31B_13866 [Hyphomicrobiales bacterium]|nr:hypothetical protein BOSEA31B_13866 [Hyphomicrobiales bacterium]CAH1699641.1 hypothetical protein BOSEA1005_12694 [Hyphomicrobiales bacterium]CAI0343375.1 hypothetical protein BO1005MUT1_240019 [Hyphomicrobiales bacterium]